MNPVPGPGDEPDRVYHVLGIRCAWRRVGRFESHSLRRCSSPDFLSPSVGKIKEESLRDALVPASCSFEICANCGDEPYGVVPEQGAVP